MYSVTRSFGLNGLSGFAVAVEADISGGLPAFSIVGLPDSAVRESADRVRAAIKNLGFKFPDRRITINLAPADVRKTGPVYDLPLLLAVLTASGQLEDVPADAAFLGELALDGTLRPVSGVLPMALAAAENGTHALYVPAENAAEAAEACADSMAVYPAHTAREVVDALRGISPLAPAAVVPFDPADAWAQVPDFADVMGQSLARRAMVIAAAGGHNVLLIGAPGTGKSMLAKRLPGILPPLTREEAVETTKIYSIAGQLPQGRGLISARPFRSPHHSASAAALAGGGAQFRPGECSLANCGVLFLDELPEFSRESLEVLRQPLEDRRIRISRVQASYEFPADFMFVAAMNPCPCGNYPDYRRCSCTEQQIRRYQSKVSGPLLDRIDIRMEVKGVKQEVLFSKQKTESSKTIRARVEQARQMQKDRFAGTGLLFNSQLDGKNLEEYITLSEEGKRLVLQLFEEQELSVRGVHRVLKLARTIADLAGSEEIEHAHLQEAAFYRNQDVFAKEVLYGN